MPSSSYALRLDPRAVHRVVAALLALSVLAALARLAIYDFADPYHCRALLTDGQWLDSRHTNWQPQGCMLHPYRQQDIAACLAHRRVLFAGDSTTRQLFFALAHAADPALPAQPTNDSQKHADYSFTSAAGTRFSFLWDPFLNMSSTRDLLAAPHDVTHIGESFFTPSILVLGAGLWHLRYAQSSGGLPIWEKNVELVLHSLTRSQRRTADRVYVLPVSHVVPSKLSPERAATIHPADIDAMNSDLEHRIYPPSLSILPPLFPADPPPIELPLSFNRLLHDTDTDDGLHYSQSVTNTQVNLILNHRCNDVLPKVYPFDKTCCRRYPAPPFLNILIIASIVAAASLLWYTTGSHSGAPISIQTSASLTFAVAVILMFVSDRTGFWLKEQKQFDPWYLGGGLGVSLLIGFSTVQRAGKDLGFLGREQTDEWKGWMQLSILIYHYFGASKVLGVYNPIRVLVASYLFMTGYGHTTFYLKKSDFGLPRVAQVLVRLNILTICLAYTMNTDYVFYYFAPLVSLWFIVVYLTMLLGAQYNEQTPFLLAKIACSAALMTFTVKNDWVIDAAFAFLEWSCNIHWSVYESRFRVGLDLWIVYAGMLTAISVSKIRAHGLTDHPRWTSATATSVAASILALLWYFAFELAQDSKLAYNAWHPYIAAIPVGAFVILRNATAGLRSAHSRAFAWVGRCSLETFIVQYHFWLAADTKGILLVIPDTRWRALNMLVTSTMFLCLSHRLAEASDILTKWFCGTKTPTFAGSQEEALLPLAVRAAASTATTETSSLSAQEQASEVSRVSHWAHRLAGDSARREPIAKRASALASGLPARFMLLASVLWTLNRLWP